jgi:hypothetical protein
MNNDFTKTVNTRFTKMANLMSGWFLGLFLAGITLVVYYTIHAEYPNIIGHHVAWGIAALAFCSPFIINLLVKIFPGPSGDN